MKYASRALANKAREIYRLGFIAKQKSKDYGFAQKNSITVTQRYQKMKLDM